MKDNRLDVNASMARPGGPPVHVTSPQTPNPGMVARILPVIRTGGPRTIDPFGWIGRAVKSGARKMS